MEDAICDLHRSNDTIGVACVLSVVAHGLLLSCQSEGATGGYLVIRHGRSCRLMGSSPFASDMSRSSVARRVWGADGKFRPAWAAALLGGFWNLPHKFLMTCSGCITRVR